MTLPDWIDTLPRLANHRLLGKNWKFEWKLNGPFKKPLTKHHTVKTKVHIRSFALLYEPVYPMVRVLTNLNIH